VSVSYRVHGLDVRSELALPGLRESAAGQWDVDVRARRGTGGLRRRPSGVVMAEHGLPDDPGYCFVKDVDGYLLRFYGVCDVRIDHDLSTVEVSRSSEPNAAFADLLVAGATIAALLILRRANVLHASAVAIDEQVLVVAGPSGSGKSTIAAMLCAVGGTLIADDVLRVELDQDGVWCFTGADELRLREPSRSLADGSNGEAAATVDGRTAFRPEGREAPERWRVDAVVAPVPSRSVDAPVVTRLPAARAARELLAAPRFPGWVEPAAAERWFSFCTDLAKRAPVIRAEVPWGPPFPADVGRDLVRAIGAELALAGSFTGRHCGA
jgi:hypothetical protein